MHADAVWALLLGLAAALTVLVGTVPAPVAWTLAPLSKGGWPTGSSRGRPDHGGGSSARGGGPGWHRGTGRRRPHASQATVPEAMELLALALLGGGSLGAAVRQVSQVLPEHLSQDLSRVGLALHHGADTAAAWSDAGPAWTPVQRCLDLASVSGVAPGPALRQAASDLRRDAIADVEVATARLGVRLVVPLGLAFLPAFVLATVLPLVLALTRDLTW